MKKKVLIVAVVVLLLTAGLEGYMLRNTIFQEGNPLPVLGGIGKLVFTGQDIVKISDRPEKYIVMAKNGDKKFIDFIKKEGYIFIHQIGAGLFFEKPQQKIVAETRMYTRFFEIIKVTRIFDEPEESEYVIPQNFGFEFKYGVNAKNILNTFENKFTKDMIGDPSVITDFALSYGELGAIYAKMQEIGLFEYSQKFEPKSTLRVTPFETYYFKVRAGNLVKEVYWEDENLSNEPKARALRELAIFIKRIVEASDQYKKLPAARGGYD